MSQHTTWWQQSCEYWGSPTVHHTLGDRRITGILWSKERGTINWMPALRAHGKSKSPECMSQKCICSYWGTDDRFVTEEEALQWLYSSDSAHWKRKLQTFKYTLPVHSLSNRRRKARRLRDQAEKLWDLAEDRGEHIYKPTDHVEVRPS